MKTSCQNQHSGAVLEVPPVLGFGGFSPAEVEGLKAEVRLLAPFDAPPRSHPGMAEWAEGNIWFEDDQGRKIPLRLLPWQREIVEVLDQRVRRVTLQMFTRAGKSLLMLIPQGHIMANTRESAMVVWPSGKLVDRFKDTKLIPFLEACPAVNRLIDRNKVGEIHSDGVHYGKGAGKIYYTTASGQGSLQQIAVVWACCDEVDSFEATEGGNYATMLFQRGRNIPNAVLFESSTPDKPTGDSAIEAAYEASDQSRWMMRHDCGEEIEFLFENAIQDEVSGRWRLTCLECGGEITEPERLAMIESGRWVAAEPERSRRHRGFYLNQFYSTFVSFQETMESYNPAELEGFMTQVMAKAFNPVEVQVSADGLESLHRSGPPPGTRVFRAIGVDSQTRSNPRFEYSVVDFYGEMTRPALHVLQHSEVVIDKDNLVDAARAVIDLHKSLRADFTFIDAGGNAPGKRDAIKGAFHAVTQGDFDGGRVRMVKGTGQKTSQSWISAPMIVGERTHANPPRSDLTLGVNSDIGKLSLYHDLKAGNITFGPEGDFPDQYLAQIANYRLERVKTRSGQERTGWKKRGPTEAPDCLLYAIMAWAYAGPDYKQAPRATGLDLELIAKLTNRTVEEIKAEIDKV